MVLVAALSGCSSMSDVLSGDKLDYKSAGAKTSTLEVPPDLTALTRDPRYQLPEAGATVTATTFASTAASTAATPARATSADVVAPQSIGDVRIERSGNLRWVTAPQTPEQLWPQLQSFWQERGFNLAIDDAAAGVMETEWAENRAKLPQDIIRNTIGKVIDSMYSTGERDKFRTRVERTANGSEIYISHRGMTEVYIGQMRDTTSWQARPTDPQLEAEMLSRLLIKLGAKDEQAKTALVATNGAPPPPSRARTLPSVPGSALQVDDGFDRAWRRVGLALDRNGFTVEDRDRARGLYFVRYVDPAKAGKDEPGFLSRMFSFGHKEPVVDGLARYRIEVKGQPATQGRSDLSTVVVQNQQGAPEDSQIGKRISALLLDELK
jgi:outer membrane protein assembly factor BamC